MSSLIPSIRNSLVAAGLLEEPLNITKVYSVIQSLLLLGHPPSSAQPYIDEFLTFVGPSFGEEERPTNARDSQNRDPVTACVALAVLKSSSDEKGALQFLTKALLPCLSFRPDVFGYLVTQCVLVHRGPTFRACQDYLTANLTRPCCVDLAAAFLAEDVGGDEDGQGFTDSLFTAACDAVAKDGLPDRVLCLLLHKVIRSCIIGNPMRAAAVWAQCRRRQKNTVEVITALSGCYDAFFGTGCPMDLRADALMWEMIVAALTSTSQDQQAPVDQKRAVYLLKRIVDQTEREPPRMYQEKYFTWRGAASKKAWDVFLTTYEMLNEYGAHLIGPALREVYQLIDLGLEPTWLYCFQVKAFSHVNVSVKRMILVSLFQSEKLEFFLKIFGLELMCGAVLRALHEVKLYTDHDHVLFDTNVKGMLPVGLHSFVFDVLTYFRRLATLCPPDMKKEFLEKCVAVLDEPGLSRVGVATILRVLVTIVPVLRGGDHSACLIGEGPLAVLARVTTTFINDHHPRWLEVRYSACIFEVIVACLGTSWSASVSVASVARFVSLLTHGGVTGGASLGSVDISGPVGNSGSILTKYGIEALRKVPWIESCKATVRTTIEDDVTAFLARDDVVESRIHLEVRNGLALLPAVWDNALLAFFERVLKGLGELRSHTYTPIHQKLRRLLLLQELLFLQPDAGPALLPGATGAELLEYCTSLVTSAIAGAKNHAHDLDNSLWQIHHTCSFDIIVGCIHTLLCRVENLTLSDPATLLRTCLHGWRGLQGYLLMVVARNALRVIHMLATLVVDSGAALPDPAGLLRECLSLPLLRTETDTRSALTTETPAVVNSQYERYVLNTCSACLTLLPLEQRSALSRSVVGFVSDYMEQTSRHNLSSLLDLLVSIADFVGPEEMSHFISNMRYQMTELDGREYYRTAAITAALIFRGNSPNPADLSVATLEQFASCSRVRYFLATFCSAAVEKNVTKWEEIKPFVYLIAIKTNTGRYDGEQDVAMTTLEPHVAHMWPSLVEAELAVPQLDSVARIMGVCTVLKVASQSPSACLDIVKDLLRMNLEDKDLTTEPSKVNNSMFPNSLIHRNRIRAWQVLCAVVPYMTEDMVEQILPTLRRNLDVHNLNSTRRLIELFTTTLGLRSKIVATLVVEGLQDLQMRPGMQGSYAFIATHVLLHHADDEWAWRTFMPVLLTQCNHFNYMMRLAGQVGIYEAMMKRRRNERFVKMEVSSDVEAIFDFIDRSPECVKWRKKHNTTLLFDPYQAITLRDIFCVQRKEADFWLMDSVPPSAFTCLRNIRREFGSVLGSHTPFEEWRVRHLCDFGGIDRLATIVPSAFGGPIERFVGILASTETSPGTETEAIGPILDAHDNAGTLQRKAVPWWKSEFHNELTTAAALAQTRHPIIVVASFVTNTINIAAFCRCCEVFGVESLAISSKKIFSQNEFIATARSAEQWVKTTELATVEVAKYVEARRREGYAIVGIEQTSNSHPLEACELPKRSVFLLGSEGHGIPVSMIQLCDMCVEIAQFGVVRSLNVQVSCAIVLHEYIRQHAQKKGNTSKKQ